jgi:hypothetical protein
MTRRDIAGMLSSMKTLIICAAAMVSVLGLGCSRADAELDAAMHTDHSAHQRTLAPPGEQLWPTDEPLRVSMLKIRSAVEKARPAYERKELRAADSRALAEVVEESVAHIAANCRLSPEPDAALHLLIARMINAAQSLKNDPASQGGLPQLAAVLHDYRSAFDHPGWSDPAH